MSLNYDVTQETLDKLDDIQKRMPTLGDLQVSKEELEYYIDTLNDIGVDSYRFISEQGFTDKDDFLNCIGYKPHSFLMVISSCKGAFLGWMFRASQNLSRKITENKVREDMAKPLEAISKIIEKLISDVRLTSEFREDIYFMKRSIQNFKDGK